MKGTQKPLIEKALIEMLDMRVRLKADGSEHAIHSVLVIYGLSDGSYVSGDLIRVVGEGVLCGKLATSKSVACSVCGDTFSEETVYRRGDQTFCSLDCAEKAVLGRRP